MCRHAAHGRFQLTFRIEQKCSRDDDTFTRRESTKDFDAIPEPSSSFYRPRLERTIAPIDEDSLRVSGIQNCFGGNGQHLSACCLERDVNEHVGLQSIARIV